MTKTEKETQLYGLLYDALSGTNQEGGILDFKLNEDETRFIVELDVVEVPEDDYIGFDGY